MSWLAAGSFRATSKLHGRLALATLGVSAAALLTPAAHAQTISEAGWTLVRATSVSGPASALSIGPTGVLYLGGTDPAAGDLALRSIATDGTTTTLALMGDIAGVAANGSSVLFSTDGAASDSHLMNLVPGQVGTSSVSDFRPSSASDDDPAGITRVPASWSGGSVVSAGEWLVVDSGDNDVVFAVSGAGVPRSIIADIAGATTLVDVAAGPSAIYLADREGARIFALSGNGSTVVPVQQTISSIVTGSSVIVGLEYDFSNDTLLLALGGTQDQLVRLTPSGANTWSAASVGTGLGFEDSATQAVDLSDDQTLLALAVAGSVRVYARCGLAGAVDCDTDTRADVCDVLIDGEPDCNGNLVPDSCDLLAASSTDCDLDLVPDECSPCTLPLDVVFNVDTSATLDDELTQLCNNLAGVVSNLAAEGIVVNPHLLGIAAPADGLLDCLESTIPAQLGNSVPGSPPASDIAGTLYDQATLGACAGGTATNDAREDWARAVSVLAGSYPFATGAIPVIVNLIDGGPYCGSAAMDQADVDALNWASDLAVERSVLVSTLLGSEYQEAGNVPTESHAVQIANATGGAVARVLPDASLISGLTGLLRQACFTSTDCNHNAQSDVCDVFGVSCADCNENGRPDECETLVSCVPSQLSCQATDAGAADAGVADASGGDPGQNDAGSSGTPEDAAMGAPLVDARTPDPGAGGTSPADAAPDSNGGTAGAGRAGAPNSDAGTSGGAALEDASTVNGMPDAGPGTGSEGPSGCGCWVPRGSSGSNHWATVSLFVAALLLGRRSRRASGPRVTC